MFESCLCGHESRDFSVFFWFGFTRKMFSKGKALALPRSWHPGYRYREEPTETAPVARLQPVAPLTIIAIFAGIAEASALATLPFLSEHSQALYTWFLVGFPFFLTALFFITLNFNYKSFYKPDARQAAARRAKASREALAEHLVEANESARQDTPRTVTLSGPASQQVIESQILHLLAQPASRESHWVFCNLDKRQCIRLSLSELADEASTDVP